MVLDLDVTVFYLDMCRITLPFIRYLRSIC